RPHRHAWVQRGVEFIEQGHRLPVATQHLAPGCAWPDLGEALIEFGFHAVSLRFREGWGKRYTIFFFQCTVCLMTLQDTVLMQLRDLILSGQFEPGQRL